MARPSVRRIQGIGAGLIPKDLNARAQLALHGLSDAPADDITALLRSGQEIDKKTRKMLADAIDGKSRKITISVSVTDYVTPLRQLIRDVARVRQGRIILNDTRWENRQSVIEKSAEKMLKSEKAAEACLTLAKKVDKWISDVRANFPERDDLSDLELTVEYLAAKQERRAPTTDHQEGRQSLVYLVKTFLDTENRALGPTEWLIT